MKGNTYFYAGMALFTAGAAAYGYVASDELKTGFQSLPVIGGMV